MKKEEIINLILSCLLTVLIGVFGGIVIGSLNNVTVRYSHSTKQCVSVTDYSNKNSEYSCDNLPDRYNHVWVQ